MTERDRDTVQRRNELSEGEQTPRQESAPIRAGRGGRKVSRRIIPVLIMLVFAFVIAREEVPLIREWSEKTFRPVAWSARQSCQKAALDRAEKRQYARILKPGKLHPTQNGLYIDRLVLGEMGPSGSEVRVEYSCYLDAQGKLHRLNRIAPGN